MGSIHYITHTVAAMLFAGLLVWQVVRGARSTQQRLLLAAFAITAIWAWLEAVQPGTLMASLAESARNLFWIGLLHSLAIGADYEARQKGLRLVYGALSSVLGVTIIGALVLSHADSSGGERAMAEMLLILRLTAAAGGLVLVHNLYGQTAPGSRASIRMLMVGLAAIWLYDLNFYTLEYVGAGAARIADDWRGLALVGAVPALALGSRSEGGHRVALSRAATFQSLSILAICAYFGVMAILATVLRSEAGSWAGSLAVTLLTVLIMGAMVVLPSGRARAWAKVKIAKHFFEHRYDYRAEWLRFTELVGGGAVEGTLGQRIVRAFADILDAPGGVLYVSESEGELRFADSWNWHASPVDPPAQALARPFWDDTTDKLLIHPLGRQGMRECAPTDHPQPTWLARVEGAHVAIPLVHDRRLVGLVLVGEPDYPRALDWEDLDLLRTAGRQAAAELAEALVQEELSRGQRFEEFNRRFAFIMHDVKNVVSQLSLLARNAERHADNPEFRADMVETLKGSVGKMNDLLARLSPQSKGRTAEIAATPIDPLLSRIVAQKNGQHPVKLKGDLGAHARADSDALGEAVGHLIQNAIDASPDDAPVTVTVAASGREIGIRIRDHGTGMSGDFIRKRLFEPFASTKDGGFGIGAFEARALIEAMRGRLYVASRPGEGTTFTVRLAAAPAHEMPAPLRKTA